MTELQILNAVKNNGGSIDFTALLNLGKTDLTWEPIADQQMIEKLIVGKVLSGKAEAYSTISFGKKGLTRLRDLKQSKYDSDQKLAYDAAKDSRQRKHEWQMVIATAVLSSLGTVLAQVMLQLFLGGG